MHNINFIKTKSKRLRIFFYAVLGIFVFLLGLTASYLVLGSNVPWANSVWRKVAAVFPVPVAIVDGYQVKLPMVEAARKAGAKDPLNYALEKAAVISLAENRNLHISETEVSERRQELLKIWNMNEAEYLSSVEGDNVTQAAFEDLFIRSEIAREKLMVHLNKPTAEVAEVEAKLKAGESFDVVAQAYSDDYVTAQIGGDTGFVSAAEAGEEVWAQAEQLPEGGWAGPINTPEGFIFVQRLEKMEAHGNNPDLLHLRIILMETFNFDQWLSEQVKKMNIRLYI